MDSLQSLCIKTYMTYYNMMITHYNNIKFKYFIIGNITETNKNTKNTKNIYIYYSIIRCLMLFNTFVPFMCPVFDILIRFLNINCDKKKLLNISIETTKVSRSIITEDDLITTIHNIDKNFNELNVQSTIPNKYIISSCILQNKEKTQINKMLFRYYDHNRFYKNTIKNILLTNNVSFDENNDSIELKIFKMRPRILTLKLSELVDNHVNDMFNLEIQ